MLLAENLSEQTWMDDPDCLGSLCLSTHRDKLIPDKTRCARAPERRTRPGALAVKVEASAARRLGPEAETSGL